MKLYAVFFLKSLFTFQYGQIYYVGGSKKMTVNFKFTFQYGQIYYIIVFRFICYLKNIYIPIWLDLLQNNITQCRTEKINLHSNMVRFIIYIYYLYQVKIIAFTFQYGQIYYTELFNIKKIKKEIYIPIWLDLLFSDLYDSGIDLTNLHSNMVRFIISFVYFLNLKKRNLHSNMVRFIIRP